MAGRNTSQAGLTSRIALYLGDGRAGANGVDLRPYFLGARANGLRIVTIKHEAPGAAALHRPVLKRLVSRMEAGEFDAIVTVVDVDVAPASLPRPAAHGDSWIAHRTAKER